MEEDGVKLKDWDSNLKSLSLKNDNVEVAEESPIFSSAVPAAPPIETTGTRKKKTKNFRPNFDARHCCIPTCNALVNAVALVRISPKMHHLWARFFDLKVHDRICYDHFEPEDYTVKDGCPRLCRGSMPTKNMPVEITNFVMERKKAPVKSLLTDFHPVPREPKEPTVPWLQRANDELLSKLVLARNQLEFANLEIARLKRRMAKRAEMYRMRSTSLPKKRIPKIVQDYLIGEKKWPEGMAKHLTNGQEKRVFPHCQDSMSLAMYLRGAMGAHAYKVLRDANLLPLPTDSAVKKRKQAVVEAARLTAAEPEVILPYSGSYDQIIVLEQEIDATTKPEINAMTVLH